MRSTIAVFLLATLLPGTAQAQEQLSNEAFVADPATIDGKLVTIGPCSLFTQPIGEKISCRLIKADGSDFHDKDGLPRNVEMDLAGLDEAAKAFIASERCDEFGFCDTPVLVTGTAKPDVIGFVGLTGTISIKAP